MNKRHFFSTQREANVLMWSLRRQGICFSYWNESVCKHWVTVK